MIAMDPVNGEETGEMGDNSVTVDFAVDLD